MVGHQSYLWFVFSGLRLLLGSVPVEPVLQCMALCGEDAGSLALSKPLQILGKQHCKVFPKTHILGVLVEGLNWLICAEGSRKTMQSHDALASSHCIVYLPTKYPEFRWGEIYLLWVISMWVAYILALNKTMQEHLSSWEY